VYGQTNVTGRALGDYLGCARKSDGTVACWGANSDGQLGNGSVVDSTSPVAVNGMSDVVEIAAAGGATTGTDETTACSCARKRDGTIFCWGDNHSGALGNGTTVDSSLPVPVGG
jgi:alpha-tubulin suppressor-like RCC1 family protein